MALEKLRERKLVQWALAYLAGAFVVFQLLDALAEPLALSATVQRVILALTAVGFFITLILAWYHGEKGRQRVSGPELLMVASLLVVAGVALALLSRDQVDGGPEAPSNVSATMDSRPGIAVLVCDSYSPDPADAYLAPGLHDEILLSLSKIAGLRSTGRTSVLRYSEDPPATNVIAEALQVEFVAECSVTKADDRIRLTFQLLDGPTGSQVWANSFDTSLTVSNLLDIYTEIAERVALEVGAFLTPEERARIGLASTDDLAAYDLYLLGRSRWLSRKPDSLLQALDFFGEAIARDSLFAPAFAGLAATHMVLPQYATWPTNHHEEYAQAKEAAARALALSPDLSEAHAVLGYIAYTYDWDWATAEEHFLRAIELSPSNADAHSWYSELLNSLCRYEEGLSAARQAVLVDPSLRNAIALLGFSYWNTGQLREAEAQFRHLLELDPDYLQGYALWSLLLEENRQDEARAVARSMMEMMDRRIAAGPARSETEDSIWAVLRAAFLEPDTAPEVLELMEASGMGWREFFYFGAYSRAMDLIPAAIADREFGLVYLNWREYSDFLGQDPRFPEVLRDIGLCLPPGIPEGVPAR